MAQEIDLKKLLKLLARGVHREEKCIHNMPPTTHCPLCDEPPSQRVPLEMNE